MDFTCEQRKAPKIHLLSSIFLFLPAQSIGNAVQLAFDPRISSTKPRIGYLGRSFLRRCNCKSFTSKCMFKFISKFIKSVRFSQTKRYLDDHGKTLQMKIAGSKILFIAITEISDNVLKGAETSGFNGMVNGFHEGILKMAMDPSLLRIPTMDGGSEIKIKFDHKPGVDELYVKGYLQAMLDMMFKQEYLRVRVIDDQVILENLPPNSSLTHEIVEHVKSFLMSKALLEGQPSMPSSPLRHLQREGVEICANFAYFV